MTMKIWSNQSINRSIVQSPDQSTKTLTSLMKVGQSLQGLNEVSPDDILIYVGLASLIPLHLLGQVAAATVLHDDAQVLLVVLGESLQETNNVLLSDRSQETDFVQAVGDLLLRHLVDLHLLQGIHLVVGLANHLVNAGKRALANIIDNSEILQRHFSLSVKIYATNILECNAGF
jgi:hypothetical protein